MNSGEHIILEDIRPTNNTALQPELPTTSTYSGISVDANNELVAAAELINHLTNPTATRDLYPSIANHREYFQKDGIYYKQFTQMKGAHFEDGQHFTIPYFPNRTFVYSKDEDEFMICLGTVYRLHLLIHILLYRIYYVDSLCTHLLCR